MRRADGGRGAYPAAVRILTRRARSRSELRGALRRKGFPEEEIREAIRRIEELGLLREREAAEAHARTLLETRGQGKARVATSLRRRGFRVGAIREVLEGIGPGEEAAALRRAFDRITRGRDLTDPRVVRRTAASLLRRGFPAGAVRQALRQAGAASPFDDSGEE